MGYDTHIRYYRSHGIQNAETFVSQELAKDAVLSGDYDIVNPLSTEPAPLGGDPKDGAAQDSGQRHGNMARAHRVLTDRHSRFLQVRSAGRQPFSSRDYAFRDITDHRDTENRSYETTAVLGGSGSNVRGGPSGGFGAGGRVPSPAGGLGSDPDWTRERLQRYRRDIWRAGRWDTTGQTMRWRFRVHSDYGQFFPECAAIIRVRFEKLPVRQGLQGSISATGKPACQRSPAIRSRMRMSENPKPRSKRGEGRSALAPRSGSERCPSLPTGIGRESWNRPLAAERPVSRGYGEPGRKACRKARRVVRVGGTKTGKIVKLVDASLQPEGQRFPVPKEISFRAGVPLGDRVGAR